MRLFIVTRHRNAIKAGHSVEESSVNAVNTAGRAVFFAGITVCIALLGQFALGLSFLYGVAVSASLTVVLTMAASLTLLPSLLGFVGMRVLSRRQRAQLRADGPVDEVVTGFWYRWARMIERRPKLPAFLASGHCGRHRAPDFVAPPGARRRRQRPAGYDHAPGL